MCPTLPLNFFFSVCLRSWILIFFTVVGVLVVFDPLGSQRRTALAEQQGLRDLESSEGAQFLSTARSLAVRVWESRLRLLCCCLPQDDSHRAAFSGIAQLVSGFFSVCGGVVTWCTGADLGRGDKGSRRGAVQGARTKYIVIEALVRSVFYC